MNLEEMFGIDKNTLPRINLSKAKVIRGQTFSQPKEMRMTLSPDGVQFSKSCIQIFEDFEYIEIMTIAEDHQIIIRKSDEYARNGLRWCKIKDGVRDSRKMIGKDFGTGIYQRFGLNRGYRYKVRGSIALRESENDEYLLVFNMLEVDPFPMTTKARENAGVLNEELDEASLTELNRLEEERNRQKEERERAKAAGEKPKKMKSSRKSPWIENYSEDFDQYEQRIKIDRLDQAEQIGMDFGTSKKA